MFKFEALRLDLHIRVAIIGYSSTKPEHGISCPLGKLEMTEAIASKRMRYNNKEDTHQSFIHLRESEHETTVGINEK